MSVQPSGSELVETQPGQVLTTIFLVTNITDQKHEFSEEVELPEGWRLIIRGFPFELDASESDTRMVSFSVPPTTLAGSYQVTYSVKNSEDANITAEQTIDVVVLSLAKLEVMLQEAPQYVIAGKEYQCDFVIVNHSNAGSRIALEIDSKNGYLAKSDPMEFRLESGESKEVNVTVETDPDLRKKIRHRLMVTAKALDFEKGGITANALSQVEIIPRITGVEEQYHKIPIRLETRCVGDIRSARQQLHFMENIGLQAQLSGSGTLTENGAQNIDFLIRGPDIQKKSVFGQRDEYRLSIGTETWEIHLGEHSYSLSPLTGQYRYGWGAGGILNLPLRKLNLRNPLSIGAHYVEPRWRPKEKQSAIRLGYQIWEEWMVDLHYLHKKETDPPEGLSRKLADDDRKPKASGFARLLREPLREANILSVQTSVEPVKNVSLEFEYGVGWKKHDNLKSGDFSYKYIDDAWRIEAEGNYRGAYCRLKAIHAGPDYPGYYSDLDYKMGTVTFPLWSSLRLKINYSKQKRNLALVPTFPTASQVRDYGLGMDYRFKIGTRLSLDYRNSQREDRFFPPRFNYERNNIRLSLGHAFNKLSIYTSAELGESDDKLAQKKQATERYRVSAHYAPTDRQRYSGYFQIGRRSSVLRSSLLRNSLSTQNRQKTMGLNAWYRPIDRTSFDVNFQRSDSGGSYNRNQLDLTLRHLLLNDHQVLLRVRHLYYRTRSNSYHKTSVMLTYTVPFDIPVSRRTSISSLRGRVYDMEHPQQQGIPDAIISVNGATAVTDQKGNFKFLSLKPGTYHIRVDQEAIGFNRVTAQKTPLEITVQGGAETEINLGVIRSATLRGRVVVFASKSESNNNSDNKNYPEGEKRDNQDGKLVIEARGKTGGGKMVEDYALAGILIELQSESEIYRRVTDGKGQFLFGDLRPGNWTLTVYENNLPKYHYPEQTTFEFHLKPGSEEELLVKILPQMRSINIIDAGELIIEEEKE